MEFISINIKCKAEFNIFPFFLCESFFKQQKYALKCLQFHYVENVLFFLFMQM